MRYSFIFMMTSLLTCGLAAQNKAKTLLWKIEGMETFHPSYIYGTIHIACPEDIVVPVEMEKAIAASHALYLELDFDDLSDVLTIMESLKMPGDTTLTSLLTKDEYEAADSLFRKMTNMSLSVYDKLMPFLTMSVLTGSFINCSSTRSWESALVNRANKKHIPVYGLETIKDQMGIFQSVSLERQAALLVSAVKNADSVETEFEQLMSVYRDKDIEKLFEFAKTSETIGISEDIILTTRNRNWIPKIKEAMQQQSVFFAVGAGHLGGKNGILNLLRMAGFSVTPIIY
jgi:uncharacterized protein YbaP (TraB family)